MKDSYNLVFRESAKKEMRKAEDQMRGRIIKALRHLMEDPRPRGVEKLTGSCFYRIRVGKYRIVYEIRDKTLLIVIIKIGHRKEVYKG